MGEIIICIFLAIILIPAFFRMLGSLIGVGFGVLGVLLKVAMIPIIIIFLCYSGLIFIALGVAIIAGIGYLITAFV